MGASNSKQPDKSDRRKKGAFWRKVRQARQEVLSDNLASTYNSESRPTIPSCTNDIAVYNNPSEHVDFGEHPYVSRQAVTNNYQYNVSADQSNDFGHSVAANFLIPNNYSQSSSIGNNWSYTGYNYDSNQIENFSGLSNIRVQNISRPNSASSFNGRRNNYSAVVRRHSFNDDYDPSHFNHYSSMQHINKHSSWVNESIYTSDNNIFQSINPDQRHYRGWRLAAQRWSSDQNLPARVGHKGIKRNSLDEECYNSDPWAHRFSTEVLLQGNLRQDFNRNVDDSYVGPRVKRKQGDNHDSDFSLNSGPYNIERSDSEDYNYNGETNYGKDYDFTADNEDYDYFNRNESDLAVLNILTFPSEWSSYALKKTGYVEILFSSPEGISLQRYFNRTSQGKGYKLCITGIVRIENTFLHTMYLLKKEEMRSRNGHVDELYLYHGTKKELLSNICDDNLNWRLSSTHRFGRGVSFSPLATYSSHYCDKGVVDVMLLCKVLTSNSVLGTDDMIIPPTENGIKYETSIKEDTSVIVKYTDNEFYPMYKIMFTKQKV